MIDIQGLKAGFGKKEILHNIHLHIPADQITAIVGQSGCGKTTFLKTLNRILEDEGGYIHGQILIKDKNIMGMPKEQLCKMVGLVFQQPIAFPFSVRRNLSYVLKYHNRLTKEQLDTRIVETLKKARLYDEVKEHMNQSALKLSGGQKQRLAIARSLCAEPEVLLLDEPCSALDMKNTIAIEELLLELKKQYTIMVVTHNLAQAQRIADSVIFMDQGKVLEMTPKEIFFREPKTQLAKEQIAYM